jgi:hypothetical protein
VTESGAAAATSPAVTEQKRHSARSHELRMIGAT